MTTPSNNPNFGDYNHPEGYTAYTPQEAGAFGNGYGTSNPDSALSNDYAGYGAPVQQSNGMALAALIVGIVSLLALLFAPLAALSGIAAIILGVLGLRKARFMNPENARKGMSIAGIVLGAVSLLLSIALMAFLGAAISQVLNSGVIEECEHLQNDRTAFEACVTDFVENDPNSPLTGSSN
ncbi:hypothetical protein SAMN04488535_0724 [Corynebacterium mycetoides]|uniref:DUF4190 domain-containing protein n=1 Tax=Corynebacterium mycetoides TaxID=38302 RepID=A0A1G9MRU5_9CORY|nr:DUF4190 domain-containing protein [Corynebacterium mycetoides]SDL76960.1 hypothetical protein SAMN04488535_0724 [Corynebacterium mycetoides]